MCLYNSLKKRPETEKEKKQSSGKCHGFGEHFANADVQRLSHSKIYSVSNTTADCSFASDLMITKYMYTKHVHTYVLLMYNISYIQNAPSLFSCA